MHRKAAQFLALPYGLQIRERRFDSDLSLQTESPVVTDYGAFLCLRFGLAFPWRRLLFPLCIAILSCGRFPQCADMPSSWLS